jgi:hypothetical protein
MSRAFALLHRQRHGILILSTLHKNFIGILCNFTIVILPKICYTLVTKLRKGTQPKINKRKGENKNGKSCRNRSIEERGKLL